MAVPSGEGTQKVMMRGRRILVAWEAEPIAGR
jgi:hypothetical protein